jgi:hypothetical protein
MVTIFSCISILSDSCNHMLITLSFIFQTVFMLFCNCLFYFSYIIVFTQHKDNITNSDKMV